MDEQKSIGAHIYNTKDQWIPYEAEYTLQFDRARYDTDDMFQEGDKLVCNTAGIYLIISQCIWYIYQNAMYQLTIRINGEMCIATDRKQAILDTTPFNHIAVLWKMEKGDFVDTAVYVRLPESRRAVPNLPIVKRARHLDSPEFMAQLMR